MPPINARYVLVLSCVCAMAVGAGCASDRGPRRERQEQRAAEAAIPEMEAGGVFFGGQVEVAVLLNRGGFHVAPGKGDDAAAERGSESAGRGRGGFRGGFGRRGGRGEGGERGEFGGRGERGGFGEGGGQPVPHIAAANQPPVQLHLRLINHTKTELHIAVPDFESELGNFVVQPDTITVPAGGSADAYPMTSRLGLTQATVPLTVELQLNGRTETQTLSLHVKPAAPTAKR